MTRSFFGTLSAFAAFNQKEDEMVAFLLWCLLLVVCWPLALLALLLYPLVWLVLLPFRIVGIAVGGVLELLKAIILLPARLLGGRGRVRA
jgi:hypothetical protein